MPSSITSQLARFAVETVPDEGARKAMAVLRLSVLDWMAVGLAGVDAPVSQITRALVEEDGGAAQAALFGVPTRVPARAAALVNGATSHALDYDDTHFDYIGHPSVAVLPAVFALAGQTGAALSSALEAALIGVEGAVRTGIWLGRAHYQAGFHQTATAGAFGATMAAGRLLGLTADQMHHAIGLCATRASGLKSQFGTMGKPFNAGIAASNGVEAAQLAARGFVSVSDGLETAQGFGPTHHGAADATAGDGLGQVWRFETVSHKFHACCHGLHAMLEALRGMAPIAPARVVRVIVDTHPRWMNVCHIADPATGLEAKFSYRLTAAMALNGIETGALESFSDAATADPDLITLRDKVSVEADATLSEMQARVRVIMDDGARVMAFHDLDAPVSIAERRARITAKSVALIGASRVARIAEALEHDKCSALLSEMSVPLEK